MAVGKRREERVLCTGWWQDCTKTRDNIVSGIDSIFSGFSAIDEDFYEEIEEILIMGDIGHPYHRRHHRAI